MCPTTPAGFDSEPAIDLDHWLHLVRHCQTGARALAAEARRTSDPQVSSQLAGRIVCTTIGLPLGCPKPSCRRSLTCQSPPEMAWAMTWCWHHIVRRDPDLHQALVRAICDRAAGTETGSR